MPRLADNNLLDPDSVVSEAQGAPDDLPTAFQAADQRFPTTALHIRGRFADKRGMVFVVVLAILAFVLIKSLMSVVARDEAATAAPWRPEPSTTDLIVERRATVNDDVRSFLLPAVPEPTEVDREQVAFEQRLFDEIAANESSRSR